MEEQLASPWQFTRADCGFTSYPIAPAMRIFRAGRYLPNRCPRPWIERRTPALVDARRRFAFLGSGIDGLAWRRAVGPGSRVRSNRAAADLYRRSARRGGYCRSQHAGAGREWCRAECCARGRDPADRVCGRDRAARCNPLRSWPQTRSRSLDCSSNGGTKAAIAIHLAGVCGEPLRRSVVHHAQSGNLPHHGRERRAPSRVPPALTARQSATPGDPSHRDGVCTGIARRVPGGRRSDLDQSPSLHP
jgi:hypothetical protein